MLVGLGDVDRRVRGVAVMLASALLAAGLPASRAFGAGNAIGSSALKTYQTSTGANILKPSACAAITLTTIVAGVNGTSGADLLLGSAAADTMNAGSGNDCVLGGGGNDAINGGLGTDVCIGGPGTDTFTNCETQIQ